MNSFDCYGFWWLPSQPENKVAGILTFNHADGIQLKLIGSFHDLHEDLISIGNLNYPIILGITDSDELITLAECQMIGIKQSRGNSTALYETWRSRILLKKFHFDNPEEMQFHQIEFSLSHLNEFAFPKFIKMPDINQDPIDWASTLPDDINAQILVQDKPVKISVTYRGNLSRQKTAINYEQSAFFKIEAGNPLSFEKWKSDFICPLQNFLTFATTQPNMVTLVNVFHHSYFMLNRLSDGDFEGDVKSDKLYLPIDVFFSQTTNLRNKLTPNMLFTINDIKDEFGKIIQFWFNLNAEIDSIFNLYFGVQYNSKLYIQNQFLNLGQAVESYHRQRPHWQNESIPDSEHKNRIESIIGKAPEEYKEWLKEKLNFSNEPSLKERLEDLLEYTKETIIPLLSLLEYENNKNEFFVAKVRNTRNYLTHFNPSLKTKAAKGEELVRLKQILFFMLQVCFLRELGCKPERCVQLIGKNKEYQFLLNLAQKQESK